MEGILRLQPHFSHTIWGGNRLREEYGYDEAGDDIGECWGISAHPKGDVAVIGGEWDGWKLSELWQQHRELFGDLPGDRFPLLVKIIDAREDLSIQVHPDDTYAATHENGSLGKTECWYVLDCQEGDALVVGHNARTRKELKEMITEGRWKDLIRLVPVRKGDFLQIDPGTVHSIKGGVMVLETQQNCDITYRVYDYDRLQNGKPRDLHLRQSLEVIRVPATPAEKILRHMANTPDNALTELYSCPYYTVSKAVVHGRLSFHTYAPFLNMTVLEGGGEVCGSRAKKGDHLILTAAIREVELQGQMQAIFSHV